jgi:hypothetical protein
MDEVLSSSARMQTTAELKLSGTGDPGLVGKLMRSKTGEL